MKTLSYTPKHPDMNGWKGKVMTHISYNARAADRTARANRIDTAAAQARARIEMQFSERAKWAGYVFLFFVVTSAAIFAVLGVL